MTEASDQQPTESKVSFYPAWCKRCGNCVAFCPRGALEADEWGHPYLARPERCTTCRLCEMLCPDFAISVGEAAAGPAVPPGPIPPEKFQLQSPERLAPGPEQDEDRA